MTNALRTVPEAAELLGISESSMWVLIRNREIDTVEIPSAKAKGSTRKMRRVEQTAIDTFIKAHRAPATSP
jgi:predicted DNA-binding transcriptional regulator AlpA